MILEALRVKFKLRLEVSCFFDNFGYSFSGLSCKIMPLFNFVLMGFRNTFVPNN
jgi:hypothetical protein